MTIDDQLARLRADAFALNSPVDLATADFRKAEDQLSIVGVAAAISTPVGTLSYERYRKKYSDGKFRILFDGAPVLSQDRLTKLKVHPFLPYLLVAIQQRLTGLLEDAEQVPQQLPQNEPRTARQRAGTQRDPRRHTAR